MSDEVDLEFATPDPDASPVPNPPEIPDRPPMDARSQKPDDGPPRRQKNGYYADPLTGARLRSVTTVQNGGVPNSALLRWTANLTAEAAVSQIPRLVAAMRDPDRLAEAERWLARASDRDRDRRGSIGTAVHKIIESRVLKVEPPSQVRVGDEVWNIDGPELEPYLRNFHQFELDWVPEWQASELIVANPEHGYAGTLDFIVSSDGPIGDALRHAGFDVPKGVGILGDTKTSGTWGRVLRDGTIHGVYPAAGMQMAAYRHATTCWVSARERMPMPVSAPVGIVLHIRPEGYALYPCRADEEIYVYFRHAQMVDEWGARIAKAKYSAPVIGAPIAYREGENADLATGPSDSSR